LEKEERRRKRRGRMKADWPKKKNKRRFPLVKLV
jgi:hypothetical protein